MKADDISNQGFVTLARGEFDFLCSKLSSLESSIAALKRELRHNVNGITTVHESDATIGANIDPAVTGRPRRLTHTDVHGVHIQNDAVCP